jgi:hypothetical protein
MSFMMGLIIGAIAGPFAWELGKVGYRKLKEKLGS